MEESQGGENVKVVVRVNPIDGTIKVEMPQKDQLENPAKVFTFDNVFPSDVKQVDVYNRVARPIVSNVLEVRVSYLEIYNEDVRDLLGKDQSLKLEVKERPDVGVFVKDLSAFVVNNADDMDKVMTMGNKNRNIIAASRSVGSTHMNQASSRSHAIFTITVECSEKGVDKQQHFRVGKLHLVDLAGSERQSKTGASGQRLKEATKINLSLSTLGNVISALVDGKSTHVPYRNSKLTRLLQDSLGGNSKTLMFANVGPANYNYEETISTLRYASRAKSIKNKAKINEDPKDALMKQYQKEIEDLKRMLEEGSPVGTEDDEDEESSEEEVNTKESENVDMEKEDKPKQQKKERKPRERRVKTSKSSSDMVEMKNKIEEERARLETDRDMAAEERSKIATSLKEHEADLATAQAEQDAIKQKLVALEKKIIVGGENLLEKAEEQEKLLEESAKELEETILTEQKLREQLKQREAERVDIEEKYSSLQEEASGKTRKLKKVWSMLQSAKAELTDLQGEQQREMEGLLDSVRHLTRELRLQMLIIDNFVPPEYQEMVEQHVQWNEEIGEWQLRCVAYTGNNMRKSSQAKLERSQELADLDISGVYLDYGEVAGEQGSRPRTARPVKSARPKSSKLRQRK